MNTDDAVKRTAAQEEPIGVEREARHRADALPQESFVVAELGYGVATVRENADLGRQEARRR